MAEVIFEQSATLVQMFIWLWFVTSFLKFRVSPLVGKIGFVVFLGLLVAELNIINSIVVYDGFLGAIVVLTCGLYALIFLKGEILQKIFVVAYSSAMLFTISTLMLFLFSHYSGRSTENLIAEFTIWRVIVVAVSRLLEFVAYKFIMKLNDEFTLAKKDWIIFITMPILTWSVVTTMMYVTIEHEDSVPQMFYIAVIMLVINIMIYVFMFKMKSDARTKMEYELLKVNQNNVKETQITMKALYESTYSVKHDLEKHLLYIKTMIGKEKYDEAEKYIDGIVENLNDVQEIIFTDNDVFNAIINVKLTLCRKKGIFPRINVSNEAVNLIKSDDVTVLIGNIFDNAIEAAEHTESKIIVLNIALKRDYVSIYMENSYDEKYSDVNLVTTKKNAPQHGMGIKSVRKIVAENGGMIDYFVNEDGLFCCDILLKQK